MDWSFYNTMTILNWQPTHPGFSFSLHAPTFLFLWVTPLKSTKVCPTFSEAGLCSYSTWAYFVSTLSISLAQEKQYIFYLRRKKSTFPFHDSSFGEGSGDERERDVSGREVMPQTETWEASLPCMCRLPGGCGLEEFLTERISLPPPITNCSNIPYSLSLSWNLPPHLNNCPTP